MKKLLPLLPLLLCLAALPALGYDLNGVKLGGKETDVKKAFPSAHCKALEWRTDAASRRCDDARVALGGVLTKITVFLKADSIQGYELRFDTKDLERVKAALRAQWGAPLAEATEVISKKDREDRKIFKMRWEKGADLAILTAQLDKKRGGVDVSRGNFATEIYRVR
jgi:hypothetical protein